MKTDIQIAQEAKMEHIKDVAARAGNEENELEIYGKYKAKLSDELWEKIKGREDGKLVLVTAIYPTPAGEGKTIVFFLDADILDKLPVGRVPIESVLGSRIYTLEEIRAINFHFCFPFE